MTKKKLTIVAIIVAVLLIVISTIYAFVSIQSNHNDIENMINPNELEYVEQQSDVIIGDTTDEKSVSTIEKHKTEVPEGYIGIYTVDDLDYIKSSPQYNYILMNDLNFNDYNREWEEYNLDGIFEGNNYTIANYNSKHPLFKYVGAVYNLTFDNAKINGLTCSTLDKKITFYSSVLCREVKGTNEIDGSIENCHINGDISIAWNGNKQIGNNYYKESSVYIGSICSVVKDNIYISNCTFNGNINVNFTDLEETSEFSVGGISGLASTSSCLVYCNSSGVMNLSSKNAYCKFNAGGITGKAINNASIQSCGNSMKITGNTSSSSYGGIVGCDDYVYGGCYITKSFNKGNITSTSEWDHEAAYTTTSIGGIVGGGIHIIENCYNTADIVGGEFAGGIIGETAGANISKVYNTGNVNCNKYKEWNQDETEVFHKGAIEGSATNKNYGKLNYCYYTNDDINAVYDNPKFPYVQHISEIDAKEKNCYQGFDFDNEWEMGIDDYPYPRLTNVNGQ